MSKLEAQESSISISDSETTSDSRFECPVCLSWLREPVLTSCGHRFCKNCIESWLQKEGACPVDNIKLLATDIFPDNFTRREILQHRANCPYLNLGCTIKLSPLDLDAHVSVCQFKDKQEAGRKCIFMDAGCVAEFGNNEEFEEHLKLNMDQHLNLLCKVYTQLKIKYEPPDERGNGNSSSSDKSQETFFWDPPTKSGNSSSELETKESLHNLLKPLQGEIMFALKRPTLIHETLPEMYYFRVLYEKIVLLEQKNREQDIILTNMAQQISVQNSKFTELPLRYCNGTFLWTVKDIKSKLETMFNEPKKMFYSPAFYTSPNGYKLCVRLNLSPNDSNYLALIIHVMKTEHDFTLDWPFNARITIILIHPSNPDINIRETMITNPDLEAFRKPSQTQTLNLRGFGYTEFAHICDLQQEGFIKNDEIYIKVQIFTP